MAPPHRWTDPPTVVSLTGIAIALLLGIGTLALGICNRIDFNRQFDPEPITIHVSEAICVSGTDGNVDDRALAFSLSIVNPGPQSTALLVKRAEVIKDSGGDLPSIGALIGTLEQLSLAHLDSFLEELVPFPGLIDAHLYGEKPVGALSLPPRDVVVWTPVFLIGEGFIRDPLSGRTAEWGGVPVYIEFEEISAQGTRTNLHTLRIDPAFLSRGQDSQGGWCSINAVAPWQGQLPVLGDR